MASRAIPPHQLISAPRMAMTALVIPARAESAATSVSPRAAKQIRCCMGLSSLLLIPGPVILLQLAVGVDDHRQLLDHGGDVPAGDGVVEFVVGQFGVDAVADATQAGH